MDSDGHIEHSIDVTHDESFATGHMQGRIRRQSTGLVFTQMGGSPMTDAELAPRSSRIVGDNSNDDEPTISHRNVQLIDIGRKDGVQYDNDAADVPAWHEPEEQQPKDIDEQQQMREIMDRGSDTPHNKKPNNRSSGACCGATTQCTIAEAESQVCQRCRSIEN
jgi:hypothetical protein